MSQVRDISRVITAHRQEEGAGFIVRRPLPSVGLSVADPFLLIDEMGQWTTHRARPLARRIIRIAASRP